MSKFVADVYGTPDPSLSREEVERIITDAEANGHHVMFGEGWKHPRQDAAHLLYLTQPPVRMGFFDGLAAMLGRWL